MTNEAKKYEDTAVRPAPVLIGVTCVLVVLVLALGALYLYQGGEHGLERKTETLTSAGAAVPGESFDRIQQAQRRHLDSYGWVDREAGIIHVPVARAAELVLAESEAGGADSDSGVTP